MTGGQLGVLYWLIKADSKEYDKAVKGTEKTAEDANKNVGSSFLALGATIGIAKAAFDKVVAVVGELIAAYAIQEQAEKRLEAVISATGHAAGFTAKEMKDMASELQGATTFGDEMIIGAQSILATFKSISGDVFPRTIEAAADLSTVFGQSLQQSTTMLGKALEDPIQGMGALKRVGVTLSEQTQTLVKDFIELGDVEAAQNEILKAVEGQVKGAARAMADTSTGALKQLGNAFGDLKEQIGKSIAELIGPFASALTGIISFFSQKMKEGEERQAEFSANIVKNMYEKTGELTDFMKQKLEDAGKVGKEIGGKLVIFTKDAVEKSKQLLDEYYGSLAAKQAEWERKRDEERAREKDRLEKVAALRQEFADKYFELKASEIDILKKERDEAIARAEEIGASTLEIRKYYNALILEEEKKKQEEIEELDRKEAEKKKEANEEIYQQRKKTEQEYRGLVTTTTKYVIEAGQKMSDAEKARQKELREEYQRTAESVISSVGSVIQATIAAGRAGEDAWDAFKKAALGAIASAVEALGKKWAIEAAAAYVTGNIPVGIGLTAASIAAYAAAALIPSLDTGGMLKQDSIVQAHKNEIIIPLDKGLDILAEKLKDKGSVTGDIYITINAGNLNTEMDIDNVMREAGARLQETIRSF